MESNRRAPSSITRSSDAVCDVRRFSRDSGRFSNGSLSAQRRFTVAAVNVGINGFGRIGRIVFRQMMK
ncbi:MAG: hypothetical protein IJO40_12530, partial [Thermoguttaceae bacterium]|nr:hypothetical protein [Thermoguttaceae bacterium]